MKPTILVLLPFEEEGKKRLEAALDGADVIYSDDASYTDEMLDRASAIIGNPAPERLVGRDNIKWVQVSWAGVDRYIKFKDFPRQITLTNVTGAFGHAISEHMVACVFSLFKKLHLYRDNQNRSLWLDRGSVRSVYGSVVLVLGLGDIGGNFAARMKALGCRVIGVTRTAREKPDTVDEIYTSDALDELLPKADVVGMALPSTAETVRIMDEKRLFSMKKGAILINVGRGSAIDQTALLKAVDSGHLGGAALDVTETEPLPENDPLWKAENVIITPHVSGFFHLRQTYDNIIDICVENAGRFVRGEKLENVIDMTLGYAGRDTRKETHFPG